MARLVLKKLDNGFAKITILDDDVAKLLGREIKAIVSVDNTSFLDDFAVLEAREFSCRKRGNTVVCYIKT